jgi:hypothetical protein
MSGSSPSNSHIIQRLLMFVAFSINSWSDRDALFFSTFSSSPSWHNFESILYHLIFRIKVWDCNVLPQSSFQMALFVQINKQITLARNSKAFVAVYCNSAFTLASAQYVNVLAVCSGASQQAERTTAACLLVSAILCVGILSPSLCLRDDIFHYCSQAFCGLWSLSLAISWPFAGKRGKILFQTEFCKQFAKHRLSSPPRWLKTKSFLDLRAHS